MPNLADLKLSGRRLRRGVIRTSMTVGPSTRKGPRVLVTSLPKSGTHLLSAVLGQFPELAKFPGNRIDPPRPWSWMPGSGDHITLGVGQARQVDRAKLRRFLSSLHPGVFITGHVPYSPELAADLAELDFKLVAMVRDPRDVVVSKVRFANSLPEGRLDREVMKNETPDRQISLATEGYSLNGSSKPIHIGSRLEKIVAWETEGALVVRFEDLVGERGGGSADVQLETIRGIREHLGLRSDPAAERQAAENSYGRSPTFRSGRSKGWQDHLSEEQARRVEELAGAPMRHLGYLD